jgi:hypothetical protein
MIKGKKGEKKGREKKRKKGERKRILLTKAGCSTMRSRASSLLPHFLLHSYVFFLQYFLSLIF